MRLVEKCNNWTEVSIIKGHHCWNCAKRNGYPWRAQPDKQCENYSPVPKDKTVGLRILQTTLGKVNLDNGMSTLVPLSQIRRNYENPA
jgi:hypothetical protein